MKMRLASLIVIILLLGGCTSLAAVELNLLAGGGFEAGSWSQAVWDGQGKAAISTDQFHGGAKSLHLQGTDKATIVTDRRFRLFAPGDPVTLSGYWKGKVTAGTGGRIVLRWLDAAGQTLADEPPMAKSGEFDWEKFEATFTPPQQAATGQLFLEIWETVGDVWYDDVRIVQQIEPLKPADILTGKDLDIVRVAVFDANAAGGTGYGGPGIQEMLAAQPGITADIISDLSLHTLVKYDTLVLPNVHNLGQAQNDKLLAANPDVAWLADGRAMVSAYVRMGGGLVLTHQSNGQGAFTTPLTPRIATVTDRTFDIKATEFVDHPVTLGLQPFESSFEDSRILRPGPLGHVIMKNESGHALAVVGNLGDGRVIGIGMCPGIDQDTKPVVPSGGEAQLVTNAVKWAAATTLQPFMVVVSPNVVTLAEPDQPLELTVTIIPAQEAADGEVALEFALAGQEHRVAPDKIADVESADNLTTMQVSFPTADLTDGSYYVEVKTNMATYDEPDLVATIKNQSGFAKFADTLPKSQFEWTAMNVHGPGAIRSEADAVQIAQMAKEMNFDAVLYNAKPPSGYQYYNTEIGEKPAGFEDIDSLALGVKACHAQGLQLLVQFCAFAEGSAANPSKFIREHPEYADWNPGDGPDLTKHQYGAVFGCPDRPEVREYELALIREMCENYDIDGISFDYIRYKNDAYCVCPYSQQKLAEYCKAHPDLSEAGARAQMSKHAIVSFTWEVRKLLDEFDPKLLLHGYCHPTWANEFPLKYLSFRASAHGKDPARGGGWSLEKVYESAKRNVELADDHIDYMVAAPMADTAYLKWAKSPERFRRELRLISHAGARDIMIYLYSTLRQKPELRETIRQELTD